MCEELVQLGAWRMLQNARGERPIDIAEHRGHAGAAEILRPQMKRRVPFGILMAIQANFHAVIASGPTTSCAGPAFAYPNSARC